jgi:hypothetical protein
VLSLRVFLLAVSGCHALNPPPLLQQHYCIAIGVKDDSGLLQRFGLPHFPPPRFVT